ncbi:SLC16A10 [Branchiostoma lanceolatum]|uniref:SLC16A10 protein n=1 Tax=Branchiostoma lanceolatum TaxID=7740 RepID=A0A8J9VK58_BRALA|nr:SLC16A10 [Branchiostoma lanceolatum]
MKRGVRTSGPPNGGYGWVVCFAAFWTSGVVFGIQNNFAVTYVAILDSFPGADAFRTAWIGSLNWGLQHLCSPLAGILVDKIGCRKTSCLGAVLVFTGLMTSSFASRLEILYVTFGIITGTGMAISNVAAITILGHYFTTRLGLVNGFATTGSCVFTASLPYVINALLRQIGLFNTFRCLSVLGASLLFCALSFKTIPHDLDLHRDPERKVTPNMNDHDDEKMPLQSEEKAEKRGRFVHRKSIMNVKHASLILPTYNNEVLVTCIGASSWAGRMFWGRIGDFPNVRRVRLHQMAFFVTGVCSTLVPVATHFAALATLTVVIGFFDGAYISLIGAIVYDMFGRKDASQAIGFNYGVCAVPLIIGMPLAGFIYDAQLSYQGTYFFAAAPMVLGACILFLIPKDNQSEMDRAMATDSEKRPLSSIEEYDETYAVAGYYNEKGHGDSKYVLITSPEEDYEVIFDRISSV